MARAAVVASIVGLPVQAEARNSISQDLAKGLVDAFSRRSYSPGKLTEGISRVRDVFRGKCDSEVIGRGKSWARSSLEMRECGKRQFPAELVAWALHNLPTKSCDRYREQWSPQEIAEGCYWAHRTRGRGISGHGVQSYRRLESHAINYWQLAAMGPQFGFRPLELEFNPKPGAETRFLAILETQIRRGYAFLDLDGRELAKLLGVGVRQARRVVARFETLGIVAVVPRYQMRDGEIRRAANMLAPGWRLIEWAPILRSKKLRKRECIGQWAKPCDGPGRVDLIAAQDAIRARRSVHGLLDDAEAQRERAIASAIARSGGDVLAAFLASQQSLENLAPVEATRQDLEPLTPSQELVESAPLMSPQEIAKAHLDALRYAETGALRVAVDGKTEIGSYSDGVSCHPLPGVKSPTGLGKGKRPGREAAARLARARALGLIAAQREIAQVRAQQSRRVRTKGEFHRRTIAPDAAKHAGGSHVPHVTLAKDVEKMAPSLSESLKSQAAKLLAAIRLSD